MPVSPRANTSPTDLPQQYMSRYPKDLQWLLQTLPIVPMTLILSMCMEPHPTMPVTLILGVCGCCWTVVAMPSTHNYICNSETLFMHGDPLNHCGHMIQLPNTSDSNSHCVHAGLLPIMEVMPPMPNHAHDYWRLDTLVVIYQGSSMEMKNGETTKQSPKERKGGIIQKMVIKWNGDMQYAIK